MSAVAGIAATSFTNRIFRFLERVDYRRIESAEDRDAVYRLRYDAYLREGSIQPNDARRFSDSDDEAENVWIFGIFLQDKLISSLRMHVSTPRHPDIPAAHVFGEFLGPVIEAGKIVVDPTRFVADHYYAKRFQELPYITTRLVIMAGEFFNADYLLATVRAEHQAFYQRVFGGSVVCPPRDYPGLAKPISMMMSPRESVMAHVARFYPFFASTPIERAQLFAVGRAAAARTAA
jgi:hypothetical protein